MKVYNKEWALKVFDSFRKRHPRVVQIDKIIVIQCREHGFVIDEKIVGKRLVSCIRIPEIGGRVWSAYKAIVKSKTPLSQDSKCWGPFVRGLLYGYIAVREELAQLPLIFD